MRILKCSCIDNWCMRVFNDNVILLTDPLVGTVDTFAAVFTLTKCSNVKIVGHNTAYRSNVPFRCRFHFGLLSLGFATIFNKQIEKVNVSKI